MTKIPKISDLPAKLNVAEVKEIILEAIINPIYTNNGKRTDRATSISKYKIDGDSIVGQFIGTQNDRDVLFDFETTKTSGQWSLTYGYSKSIMEDKRKYTPEEIKQFEAFSLRVAQATFAKKCEYPEGEDPIILSPEESKKDPEYRDRPNKSKQPNNERLNHSDEHEDT